VIAAELGARVACAVRLHLTYAELLERDPSYGHAMSVGDGKFGCYVATGEALAACEAIVAAPELDLVGFSHHVGFSGYLGDYTAEREVMHHETSAREVAAFANLVARRLGVGAQRLDLGGGFRSDGTVELSRVGCGEPPRTSLLPSLPEYAAAIFDTLEATLELDELPLVQFETGGFQVADATVLLTTVQETKTVPRGAQHLRYVVVDSSAMMFVSRNSMAVGHPVVVVDRPQAQPAGTPAEIVGQTCVYDTIADNLELPEVRRGDVLAVLDQGAYCETESTQFNAFPRPEVVLLDAGETRVVRRRETFEDVVARDAAEFTEVAA
jgi:diaminopimelate decarboxylase